MKRFSKNSFFTEKNPTIVSFPIKTLDLGEYVDKKEGESYVYDLVGNVIHDGKAGTGTYRVQAINGTDWFELQDLRVEKIMPQQVTVSESYLLMF